MEALLVIVGFTAAGLVLVAAAAVFVVARESVRWREFLRTRGQIAIPAASQKRG